jgi:signal transduction histidine kinase
MDKPKKFSFHSLRAKIIYTLLGAAACSVVLFLGGRHLSDDLINNFYMKDSLVAKRTQADAAEFQAFVTENQLSSKDTKSIVQWTMNGHDMYMVFLDGDQYLYEVGWGNVYEDAISDDYQNEPEYAYQTITFSDRTLTVIMIDFSEYALYDVADGLLLALCMLIFLSFFLFYVGRLNKKVILLSQKVNNIGTGNLQEEISLPGDDEISHLAADIDRMRLSILEQMQSEEAAWRANSDLITAISHDIRTPLTALIGYLDLSVGKQYDTQEQLDQYIQVCQEKAMQLKSLTDELFQYFLIFGRKDLEVNLLPYNGPVLLQQLLGEHIVDLQLSGFAYTEKPLNQPCEVLTDTNYLSRVFDNLFINIKKHGDKSQPVRIYTERDGDFIHIFLINEIPKIPNPVESTKIGLKTCEKIVTQLGGFFHQEKSGHRFFVELAIPCRDVESEPQSLSASTDN